MDIGFTGTGRDQGLEGRKNRGEGFKIASGRFNAGCGLVMRSFYEGIIYEVVLIYDALTGTYGTEIIEEDGETFESWTVTNLTPEEQEIYSQFQDGFVEVIFNGNTVDQNTGVDPYGQGEKTRADGSHRHVIAREVYNRFYEFPEIGIPISVTFDRSLVRTFGPQRDRKFLPFKTLVETNAPLFLNIGNHKVTLDSGIILEFIFSPFKPGKDGSKGQPTLTNLSIGSSRGRAALVWQGEMYSVMERDTWAREAYNYGLGGLSSELTVLVHLPETFGVTDVTGRPRGVDDRYRQHLMLDGERLDFSQFRSDIVNNIPSFIKALRDSKKSSTRTSGGVKNDLRKYQIKMKQRPKPGLNGITKLAGITLTGNNSPNLTVSLGGSNPSGQHTGNGTPNNHHTGPSDGGGKGNGSGGNGDKVVQATLDPKSTKRVPIRQTAQDVPDHQWVYESQLVDHPSLRWRGALYNPSENEYILNGEYAEFREIMDTAREYFADTILTLQDQDLADLLEERVRDRVALSVGKVIVKAEQKRGWRHWTSKDIDDLTSINTLTAVFETVSDDLGDLIKAVKKTEIYRISLAKFYPASVASAA